MPQPLTPDVQQAFANTLAQFLPQQTQPFAQQQDQPWWQQCLQNKRLYNAYYDLAEQLYDVVGFPLEQSPDFQGCLLQQILQQGRLALYVPVQNSLSQNHTCSDQDVEHAIVSPKPDLVQAASVVPESENEPFKVANDATDLAASETMPLAESHAVELIHLPVVITNTSTEPTPSNPIPNNVSTPRPTEAKTVKKMPYFQIPNARVGQTYQATIQMQYPVKQEVQIHHESVRIPENLGICFDAVTQQLSGIPTQAGEFKLIFQYKTHNEPQAWLSGEVTFIVTADPRSLWQVNEPDPNAPYWKEHRRCQWIETANFNLAACSQRGRSHEHAGTFRDDDFFIAQVENSDWSVLVVADGAGSAEFSRQGSLLAVQRMGQVLVEYVQQHASSLDTALSDWEIGVDTPEMKEIAHQLGSQFRDVFYQGASLAVDDIEMAAQQQQVASKVFSTTLLAAVVKQAQGKTFVSSFWIGDGAIAVYVADKVRLMGKPDGGEFAGQTRFLNRQIVQQLSAQVNVGYYDDSAAVILMTDGISDPRFETDAGLANAEKWHAFWQEIEPNLQQAEPEKALLEWSTFFSAGHHDDRTLAILWQKSAQAPEIESTTETGASTDE